MLTSSVLVDFFAHLGLLLTGAGRTAHDAADAVKHEWNCVLVFLVLVGLFTHLGLLLTGAGRTAHEAAETVKQEGQGAADAVKQGGQEAGSLVKKAGEALEEGFVAAVQAPRHLAEAVKHRVIMS